MNRRKKGNQILKARAKKANAAVKGNRPYALLDMQFQAFEKEVRE